MKKTSKVSIEEIEERAVRGEDVTMHFAGNGKMRDPLSGPFERVKKDIQRVNVDFTEPMLKEIDAVATELNISRQSVIKMWMRDKLDHHHLAKKARA